MKIKDLNFKIQLQQEVMSARIKELAGFMNKELRDLDPVFIAVLNGSFMFASDLFRELDFPCQIQFIKVASYEGTESTGTVKTLIGLNQELRGRNVVILEDIIDSGLTVDHLAKELATRSPLSLRICSLLIKPNALKVDIKPTYIGFEVENDFLVGYGLDYEGYGRNLKHIYVLSDPI